MSETETEDLENERAIVVGAILGRAKFEKDKMIIDELDEFIEPALRSFFNRKLKTDFSEYVLGCEIKDDVFIHKDPYIHRTWWYNVINNIGFDHNVNYDNPGAISENALKLYWMAFWGDAKVRVVSINFIRERFLIDAMNIGAKLLISPHGVKHIRVELVR
jgi:hypothetical protein